MLLVEAGLVFVLALSLVPVVRWVTKSCGKILETAFMWVLAAVLSLTAVGMLSNTSTYKALRGVDVHEAARNVTSAAAEGFFAGAGAFARKGAWV